MTSIVCPKCASSISSQQERCPVCGNVPQRPQQAVARDPYLDTVIGDKFVLTRRIGSGGMANVYMAEQKGLGRTVAVKIMHRHLLGDDRAAARFINEARAAAQLNHPHVISVLDFGQSPEGLLYIVMEYLRGRSLGRVIRREFPIPFGRVATILVQVMDAVEEAHKLNIIHRDLKPDNIFLEGSTGEDFVKVLDFGVAKLLEREGHFQGVTSPGMVPGTPEYMSPEQAKGEPLDRRSDVYSLGVIFYEMLTRTVPFHGKTAFETMVAHVQDPPLSPSKRLPDRGITPALDTLVLWALAKDPNDRIPSAGQFREVLTAWAEVSGIWPSTELTPTAPLERRTSVLLGFFNEEEVSRLVDGLGEEEHSRVVRRPVPRLRMTSEGVQRVGREAELERILEILRSLQGRIVRLEAPPGGGKARLVQDLVRQIGRMPEVRVVQSRPDPGWATVSLSPIQRVSALCLGRELSALREVGALEAAALEVALDGEGLPGLKELLGFPGPLGELAPDARRRERAVAFRDLVHRTAAKSPLLLVFEEIDRYDQPSQELVAHLAAAPPALGLSVLITHDPEHLQLWPTEVEHVSLRPLSSTEGGHLVQSMLEQDDPVHAVRICQSGQGNPLLIQQAVFASVFEDITDIPEHIADLLVSRVERLPQNERDLLQWMAVLNDAVTGESLMRLTHRTVDPLLMDTLALKGFLKVEAGRCSFFHRIVAMAIHSSIPAEVRRRMHGQVALHHREAGSALPTMAFHSFEAQDGPQAVDEARRAGLWAERCLDPTAAKHWYSRALDMVRREWGKGRIETEELDRMAEEFAHRLAEVLRQTGETSAAQGILEETLSVAAAGATSRAALRLELGRIDLELGDLQRAARRLRLAHADARSSESIQLRRDVARTLALATGLLGELEEAGQLLQESIAGSDQPLSWRTLLDTANVCSQIGLSDRAPGILLLALKAAERESSSRGKLLTLARMAQLHQSSQELERAETLLRRALGIMQSGEGHDRSLRIRLLLDLGRIRRMLGDNVEGLAHLELAQAQALAYGDWEGMRLVRGEMELLRYEAPRADGGERQ